MDPCRQRPRSRSTPVPCMLEHSPGGTRAGAGSRGERLRKVDSFASQGGGRLSDCKVRALNRQRPDTSTRV